MPAKSWMDVSEETSPFAHPDYPEEYVRLVIGETNQVIAWFVNTHRSIFTSVIQRWLQHYARDWKLCEPAHGRARPDQLATLLTWTVDAGSYGTFVVLEVRADLESLRCKRIDVSNVFPWGEPRKQMYRSFDRAATAPVLPAGSLHALYHRIDGLGLIKKKKVGKGAKKVETWDGVEYPYDILEAFMTDPK